MAAPSVSIRRPSVPAVVAEVDSAASVVCLTELLAHTQVLMQQQAATVAAVAVATVVARAATVVSREATEVARVATVRADTVVARAVVARAVVSSCFANVVS